MNKKSILVGAFVFGAFTLGTTNAFANLGTGNDVRENVASGESATFVKHTSDLSYGEGKCGDKKTAKVVKKDTVAGKSKEMKCGEGKCGDKNTKKVAKTTTKTAK